MILQLAKRTEQKMRLLTLCVAALPVNTAHEYHLDHPMTAVQPVSLELPIQYHTNQIKQNQQHSVWK